MKLLAVALLIFALAPHALADEKTTKPATKVLKVTSPTIISAVDAAKLDAALAHVDFIIFTAQTQLAPYSAEIDRICKIYKIDRATLNQVKIDPKTGEITRPASEIPVAVPTLVAPVHDKK